MGTEVSFRIILEDNQLSYQYGNLAAPVHVKKFEAGSLEFKTISLLATLARNKQLTKDQLGILGEHLYSVLLRERVFDKLTDVVRNAKAEDCLVRIELVFRGDDRSFFEWPWEYIYRPDLEGEDDINMFLTEDPRYLIVRHLFKEDYRSSLIDGDEIRILFVASGPTLNTKNKKIKFPPIIYNGIEKVLTGLSSEPAANMIPFKINLSSLIDMPTERCTIENFIDKLKTKPHIIHILAHGRFNEESKKGEILFMKNDGSEDWITGDRLKILINDDKNVKLIFLESCETGTMNSLNPISGIAQQVSDINVPSVIAMQSEIVQTDAHLFAGVFYKTLFEGRSVYSGMKEAIIAIRNSNLKDENKNSFGIPVLYARDEGVLFKMTEERNSQQVFSVSANMTAPSNNNDDNDMKTAEDQQKIIEELRKQIAALSAQTSFTSPNTEGKSPLQTKIEAGNN
ncbi:MAG: CHAT domain-containing protein [Bacteroidetes bacterium]|nr:CHAT domain-containing protein [Bacteroidota bacterium]